MCSRRLPRRFSTLHDIPSVVGSKDSTLKAYKFSHTNCNGFTFETVVFAEDYWRAFALAQYRLLQVD
jgi:hypothetical protein|nr:MAG TPA: hypothetical protein [Crassvirales sp.]